jgi:hypothetical protein
MADLVLLRVPIDDKSEEFIEVQVAADELGQTLPTGPQPAADDGARIKKAGFTLSSAMDGVMPALRVILGKLRDGVHSPDEITMTLGLQIGGETGIVFAKGAAQASVEVTATWRKDDRPNTADASGEAGR